MCGLQPELEQQVKQRLQLKKPDHNPQDPYDLEDIYDAASYVLQGMAPVATSSLTSQTASALPAAEIKTEIQTALATAVATLGEMFKNALEAQNLGNRSKGLGNSRLAGEATSKCNFCSIPGHFMRECEIVAEYIRMGKCKRSPKGKIVLPSGAVVPHHITGAWLRDRIDEYHRQNPGQMGAAQMLYEMSRSTTTATPPIATKSVWFARAEPEPGQAGVYAFKKHFAPRVRNAGRASTKKNNVPAVEVQNNAEKEQDNLQNYREPPPHIA